jgi:hypothetical protein
MVNDDVTVSRGVVNFLTPKKSEAKKNKGAPVCDGYFSGAGGGVYIFSVSR